MSHENQILKKWFWNRSFLHLKLLVLLLNVNLLYSGQSVFSSCFNLSFITGLKVNCAHFRQLGIPYCECCWKFAEMIFHWNVMVFRQYWIVDKINHTKLLHKFYIKAKSITLHLVSKPYKTLPVLSADSKDIFFKLIFSIT